MNLIEKIKNYQGIRTDILFITLQSVIVYCVFIALGITVPYLNYVLILLALCSVRIISTDSKRKLRKT